MEARQNLIAALTCAVAFTTNTQAQIPASLVTPDKIETRIGTLEFTDGVPSKATAEKVYRSVRRRHSTGTGARSGYG